VLRELGPLSAHPVDEVIDQRRDVLAAREEALLAGQAVDLAFQHEDGVHLANRLEGDRRDRGPLRVARLRSDVGELEQLAPRMRPARRLPSTTLAGSNACAMASPKE